MNVSFPLLYDNLIFIRKFLSMVY